MKRYGLYICIAYLFCATITLFAQDNSVEQEGPDGSGVRQKRIVLLLGVNIAHPDTESEAGITGYNVYRSLSSSTKFKKQNGKPISLSKTLDDFAAAIGKANYAYLLEAYELEQNPDELWKVLIQDTDTTLVPAMLLSNLLIAKALGVIWYDDEAKQGEYYNYRVTLLDKNGIESEPSPITTLRCCDRTTELLKPRITSAKAGNTQSKEYDQITKDTVDFLRYHIDLRFYGDSLGNKHHVYRAYNPQKGFQRITDLPLYPSEDPSEALVFRDTVVEVDQSYYYAIASEDIWGNSLFSDTMKVDILPLPLESPQKLRAESVLDGIRLAWIPPNEKERAEYYTLLRFMLKKDLKGQNSFHRIDPIRIVYIQ